MHPRPLIPTLVLSILLPACTPQHRPSAASAPAAPFRVLFIGNSLTYSNNLPAMLEKMSAAESPPLHCESVTLPGVSLAFHRFAAVADLTIKSHHWDFIILQDYSTRPLEHPDATTASVRAFQTSIHNAGARPILFENWPRRDHLDTFPTLHAHYQQISRDTDVPLAPIGEAWTFARRRLPWFAPYVDDRHPSRMGTCLAACVLFETIYSHSPSARLLPRDITPEQGAALVEIATSLAPAKPLTTTTSK